MGNFSAAGLGCTRGKPASFKLLVDSLWLMLNPQLLLDSSLSIAKTKNEKFLLGQPFSISRGMLLHHVRVSFMLQLGTHGSHPPLSGTPLTLTAIAPLFFSRSANASGSDPLLLGVGIASLLDWRINVIFTKWLWETVPKTKVSCYVTSSHDSQGPI